MAKKKPILSFAEAIAIDDRPRSVKAGRRGRPLKWRLSDVAPELNVATAVEILRYQHGIQENHARTPESIYIKAGARHGVSKRSARRYYMKHREHARLWAYIHRMDLSRHVYPEMKEIYGDKIGDLPARTADRIYRLREQMKVSELSDFDKEVRNLIIGQKPSKP